MTSVDARAFNSCFGTHVFNWPCHGSTLGSRLWWHVFLCARGQLTPLAVILCLGSNGFFLIFFADEEDKQDDA
jgi:hypothetical protein